ncbi:MAG TPA: tRNA (N(6)-L-threonylcarbamoyladenosine(37)-C(2))-methylthiotransferase [Acidilobales archaeon]|nr:tRNA (N(6)-L-threonylcarbamoyladenosine(37)-C(2))-methylthiotransferase [Acidilobales archaeon]
MKVYLENYGCPLNKADGHYMLNLLLSRGHTLVENPEKADVIIINTCTVRKDTENRMVKRIVRLRKTALKNNAKLIVAGCMPKAQPYLVMRYAPEASMLSPQNYDKILCVVEKPGKVVLLKGERRTDIVPMFFENAVAAIPIAEGCVGNCSYCIVKLARGKLRSYPPKLIIEKVREAVEKGAVEIDLTAQDTAAYGLDLGIRLTDLLREVVKVNGNFMVRVGMMNPNLAYEILDDLIEIYKHPKIFKFLHIPLQSGDNRVLKIMNRGYTIEEFKEIVYEFRRKIPEINVTTDIIVGHPGEDEEAFQNTLNIVKELEFDRIHIAAYSLRPHTASASMKQIPSYIVKERLKKIVKLMEKIAFRKLRAYVGKTVNVLVTEKGRNRTVIARTVNYHPVVIFDPSIKLGSLVKVRIIDNTFYDLRGEKIC